MSYEFSAIFAALRPIYASHAEHCIVLDDMPERYFLGTHEIREKDGYRTEFGGVQIRRSYVSAYLMPVYIHPALADDLSPSLLKRRQGKSCFNFKRLDAGLFDEFAALVQSGVAQFKRDGRL